MSDTVEAKPAGAGTGINVLAWQSPPKLEITTPETRITLSGRDGLICLKNALDFALFEEAQDD